MEAADLEKHKHNNTRMEVFARLAKLEAANADLAKSLATLQWNLEQVELKEVNHEELRRKISDAHQANVEMTRKEIEEPT
ncbi:golgin candidate 2 [Prunus yedoensis var. nudiflora]|uniref:Golgin candidate 2 n=1 Tax=Prunus yedoensis var. nudiflora TaxID=2094558 RepID=A0A314YVX7_PRUYE|nr:golgin candidate 2 [Prunus yedoensis var. nudiflora]